MGRKKVEVLTQVPPLRRLCEGRDKLGALEGGRAGGGVAHFFEIPGTLQGEKAPRHVTVECRMGCGTVRKFENTWR